MTDIRRAAACLIAAIGLATAACSTGGGASSPVTGSVLLGPTCPVERDGQPCPTPNGAFAGKLATASEVGGEQSASAAIGTDGRFTIMLSAGTWDVTADAGMSCDTVRVVVADAQPSPPLTVNCDTGIR